MRKTMQGTWSGERFLDLPDNMDEELGQMNSGKNGHPFVYSECLVMAIIGILQLDIALRCAEGMAIAAWAMKMRLITLPCGEEPRAWMCLSQTEP